MACYEFAFAHMCCVQDLIQKLCCAPKDRLGRVNIDEIKKHPFFEGIDWNNLWQGKNFTSAEGLKS